MLYKIVPSLRYSYPQQIKQTTTNIHYNRVEMCAVNNCQYIFLNFFSDKDDFSSARSEDKVAILDSAISVTFLHLLGCKL